MEYTFLSNTFFNTYVGNNTFTSVDKISVGNSTVNVAANSTTVTVGNTLTINTGSINISNTLIVNAYTITVGSNVSLNTSSLIVGANVSVNTSTIKAGPNLITPTTTRFLNYAGAITATNNMTVGTQTGQFYFMDFATTGQVINLPAANTIQDGYNVVIGTSPASLPTGFQTARVTAANTSQNVVFRGISSQNFYLIGVGEHFRFTWMNGLNYWLAECVVQPARITLVRSYSGAAAWNSGYTSWTFIPFNVNGGTTAPFNSLSNYVQLPVTGTYWNRYGVYMSAAAGGGVTGTGYSSPTARNLTGVDGTYNYVYSTLIVNEDSMLYQTSWSTVYAQGEYSGAMMLMSSTAIWWYPPNSLGTVELVGR